MPIENLDMDDLAELYHETIMLRDTVLEWSKKTGFDVSSLVSRSAEHDIERRYGKMKLESP